MDLATLVKLAEISSANKPSFTGKPMPKVLERPRTRTPTTPGLGERMRTETSKALESGLRGKTAFATGLESTIKSAGLPTARALPAAGGGLMSAARALPGRMWGAAKAPLALGAVGAAGALAYGMHRQTNADRENQQLVYAPMQGAMQ